MPCPHIRAAELARFTQLWVVLLLSVTSVWAADSRPTEYDVKAAFLLNFARFVEWPEDTTPDTLRICIVGKDPFDGAFDRVLGRLKGNRPIDIQQLSIDEAPTDCHILFVSKTASRKLDDVLRRSQGLAMLTVSDADDFAPSGGMIGFVTRKNKIRFQINPAAANRAGLHLSAKLLRLPEIVDDESVDDKNGS